MTSHSSILCICMHIGRQCLSWNAHHTHNQFQSSHNTGFILKDGSHGRIELFTRIRLFVHYTSTVPMTPPKHNILTVGHHKKSCAVKFFGTCNTTKGPPQTLTSFPLSTWASHISAYNSHYLVSDRGSRHKRCKDHERGNIFKKPSHYHKFCELFALSVFEGFFLFTKFNGQFI